MKLPFTHALDTSDAVDRKLPLVYPRSNRSVGHTDELCRFLNGQVSISRSNRFRSFLTPQFFGEYRPKLIP